MSKVTAKKRYPGRGPNRRQIEETTSDYDKRNCRSSSRNSRAVVRSSASALRRDRDEEERASKTHCTPRVRRSRKASSQAAVWHSVRENARQREGPRRRREDRRADCAPRYEELPQLADNAGKEGALVVEEVKKRKGNEG